MMNNNESYKFLNFTIDFFSGAIAGVGMVVSAFPFDTIKVRLQANSGKNFIKIL